jgi:hypothetical protein
VTRGGIKKNRPQWRLIRDTEEPRDSLGFYIKKILGIFRAPVSCFTVKIQRFGKSALSLKRAVAKNK